jgi:hypothetical protein
MGHPACEIREGGADDEAAVGASKAIVLAKAGHTLEFMVCFRLVPGGHVAHTWLVHHRFTGGSRLVCVCLTAGERLVHVWFVAVGGLHLAGSLFPADSWMAHVCFTDAISLEVVRGWGTIGS